MHADRSGRFLPSEASKTLRDLRQTHGAQWAGEIQNYVERYEFYRGFVEAIKIDAAEFLELAPKLYSLAPIRKLFLTGVLPVIDLLLQSPYLQRIVSLQLDHQKLGDGEVRKIAASPNLTRVRSLGLRGTNMTLAGVEALAACSTLPSLEELDLGATPAEIVKEDVWADQGGAHPLIYAQGSLEGDKLEAKYGRKAWLHTVQDHGFRMADIHAES